MRRAILLLVLLLLAEPGAARAQDGVWSALVLATNEKPARLVPEELKPFAAGLRDVFGYNSFYLLGAKEEQIREGGEEWIVPTKKVFLKVRCIDRAEKFDRVQLDLYVRKELVASSEVKLGQGSPLYIRGPSWGSGRLVFILERR